MSRDHPNRDKNYWREYRAKRSAEGNSVGHGRTPRSREYRRSIKYGLSQEQFEQLWADQRGMCAICSEQLEENSHKMHVDHDHVAGKVRGLLCNRCNVGIGMFRERTDFLLSAVVYLEDARKGFWIEEDN